MANLSKAVCHGESDKCRFGNPPLESNFQRLGITSDRFGHEQGLRPRSRWFRGGSFTNNGSQAAGLSKNFAVDSMRYGAPGEIRTPDP
jgi:hypothetical protein